MDEITLEEILTHYISRIRIAMENIEKQKKDIEQLVELLDDGISGNIKEALNDKLEESIDETDEIYDHLEDTMFFLKRQLNEVEEAIIESYSLFL